ncbi:23S rRNA (uracil(1939)-C(5))-methyltransferase RlmD [Acetobacteroides hydrogenigenes]|uniref:23S rRNA (Uracil1939-C5)-methyltransferase n=1 Tax=Acetobacteroides hydrogenigenes TaxID=979970 RepID=A0A4R2ETL8_9BACT|nr:23S rRNA (uracil(1939)-C(5))-methyltransferase RlmD [Acetobacteroides hydrogenigenes]TCN70114.1 23S rRNA (uracil1939-C5)-methyltransferase [Acetobacteroides hydrogenigenes]
MGRKRKPAIENLEIVDVAAEGKAIGRYNDMVVFVPQVIPGDVVNIQVNKMRKNYMEGFVTKLVTPSPLRVTPFCQHFGVCGGCKWQHLPYELQLQYKHKQVVDQLTRIGHIDLSEITPILGSEKIENYRNKLEYTFSSKRWITIEEVQAGAEINQPNALGFHIPGMFDKVLDIEKCHLQSEPSNAIRLAVRDFTLKNGYEFFDIRNQVGLMRNLIIRTASTGEVMVIVVFYYEDEEKRIALLNHLKEQFPQITSLQYIINTKGNDSITDQEVVTFAGKDHIIEEMEGLKFKVGPKSFYQTNSEQAYVLYKVTRDFAGLTGNEVVYDLYTGTGTIANFVASKAKKVVGVEYVPEAIEDAKVNSDINGIANTTFYAGDMKDVLNDRFIAENGQPDVIILDPPRAGIHEDVANTILRAMPKRIVYVSCNPATQARDIALLAHAYEVKKVQPVDMFPHTHHVENVVLMDRK